MKVTKETVNYVANLSRLTFTDEEAKKMAAQMDHILKYMEQLNELDTTNVIPMEHVKPISNVFRDDLVVPSYDRSELLKNAPTHENGAFKVPKIVE